LISGGSALSRSDHTRIQRLGKPKVAAWIESGEIGTIGFSVYGSLQPQDTFYHTTWRDNLFETVTKEGHNAEFGRRGRIIVTRLNTAVQPLIRYDLEDEGQFSIRRNEVILRNISKT
jgi:phenylacetate-coenzyme A ligase PaaK-like adenylate-forming protein